MSARHRWAQSPLEERDVLSDETGKVLSMHFERSAQSVRNDRRREARTVVPQRRSSPRWRGSSWASCGRSASRPSNNWTGRKRAKITVKCASQGSSAATEEDLTSHFELAGSFHVNVLGLSCAVERQRNPRLLQPGVRQLRCARVASQLPPLRSVAFATGPPRGFSKLACREKPARSPLEVLASPPSHPIRCVTVGAL